MTLLLHVRKLTTQTSVFIYFSTLSLCVYVCVWDKFSYLNVEEEFSWYLYDYTLNKALVGCWVVEEHPAFLNRTHLLYFNEVHITVTLYLKVCCVCVHNTPLNLIESRPVHCPLFWDEHLWWSRKRQSDSHQRERAAEGRHVFAMASPWLSLWAIMTLLWPSPSL